MGERDKDRWTLRRYHEESRSLRNSALLTAPVVLLYEVGLVLAGDGGARNAADALIDQGLMALGRPGALAVNLAVLAAFVGFAVAGPSRKATPVGLFVPVVVESAVYAGALLAALLVVVRRPLLATASAADFGLEGLVLALGAGFYEELVFRLVAIGGTLVLAERLGLATRAGRIAFGVLVLSSVGFSAFHHVGLGAEAFTWTIFSARCVAGLVLGALYIVRGFGVACYTHVLYDVFCVVR